MSSLLSKEWDYVIVVDCIFLEQKNYVYNSKHFTQWVFFCYIYDLSGVGRLVHFHSFKTKFCSRSKRIKRLCEFAGWRHGHDLSVCISRAANLGQSTAFLCNTRQNSDHKSIIWCANHGRLFVCSFYSTSICVRYCY